jgi:hypothetical protein
MVQSYNIFQNYNQKTFTKSFLLEDKPLVDDEIEDA